jgi:hypothetical protein
MQCLEQLIALSKDNPSILYAYLNDVCKIITQQDLAFYGGPQDIFDTVSSIESDLDEGLEFESIARIKFSMFPHPDVILLFILKIDVFFTYPTLMNPEDLKRDTYGLISFERLSKSRARMGIQFSTWMSRAFKDSTKVPLWAIFEPFAYQQDSIRVAFRSSVKGLTSQDPIMTMSEDYQNVPYATQNRTGVLYSCDTAPRSIVYTFDIADNFHILKYSSRTAPFQPHKDYGPHFEILEGPALLGVKSASREAQTISLTCETHRLAEIEVKLHPSEKEVELSSDGLSERLAYQEFPEDAIFMYINQRYT